MQGWGRESFIRCSAQGDSEMISQPWNRWHRRVGCRRRLNPPSLWSRGGVPYYARRPWPPAPGEKREQINESWSLMELCHKSNRPSTAHSWHRAGEVVHLTGSPLTPCATHPAHPLPLDILSILTHPGPGPTTRSSGKARTKAASWAPSSTHSPSSDILPQLGQSTR